ncbi:hypothetical protein Tco_1480294, partial [Tanacetum coccineum]
TMDKTQELKRITMLQEMRDDDRKATRKKQEAMSKQALQEAKEAEASRHKEALEAVTDVGVDQAVMKMLTKKVGEAASAMKESVAQGLKQAFGGKDDN